MSATVVSYSVVSPPSSSVSHEQTLISFFIIALILNLSICLYSKFVQFIPRACFRAYPR